MSEISMDGCFIDSTVQGRALGDIVDFKVHLPSGPWVSLKGELVYENYPMGFGLRFTGLSDGDLRLVAQVVVAHGGDRGLRHGCEADRWPPRAGVSARTHTRGFRAHSAEDGPCTGTMS